MSGTAAEPRPLPLAAAPAPGGAGRSQPVRCAHICRYAPLSCRSAKQSRRRPAAGHACAPRAPGSASTPWRSPQIRHTAWLRSARARSRRRLAGGGCGAWCRLWHGCVQGGGCKMNLQQAGIRGIKRRASCCQHSAARWHPAATRAAVRAHPSLLSHVKLARCAT